MGEVWRAIDRGGEESPHAQLRRQIENAVVAGDLAPGDRLPPVRQLATDLGLAPNTVAKVIRELERSGVLETRGRLGTFVADTDQHRRAVAEALAGDFAAAARAAGWTLDEARRRVGVRWAPD